MNHETWNLIKTNKNFNVRVFRRGASWLVRSIALNIVLVLCLFYVYIKTPERDYYATSGITPPVLLKALSAPNFSSVALLEPDPPTEDVQRVIPE